MPEKKVRFDDFVLDFGRFQLSRRGCPLKLEGLPLQLLMLLVEQQGQLVTREQIAENVEEDVLRVQHVDRVRRRRRAARVHLVDHTERGEVLRSVVVI